MFHDHKKPLEPEYIPVSSTEEARFSGFYETGSTRPPKRHGGALAAVLLTCIFLGGVMGVCLIRVAREPAQELTTGILLAEQGEDSAIPEEATSPIESTLTYSPISSQRKVRMEISKTPEAVPNVLESGGLSLQEIYKKVNPSVVSITAATETGSSYGSGIIMSISGYVITNSHVVSGATEIMATLSDGQAVPAQLVGQDELSDLAVLLIEAEDLVAAEFGDSDVTQVGDSVVAIGNPVGPELSGTMTDGIISAINRNLQVDGADLTLLQTTAALNEGNSGGPLINCYGQVIGITTMKMSNYSSVSATVEGLGFAIPITSAKPIIDELIERGYVSGRPAIGIQGQTLDLRAQFFYNLPSGVIVTSVVRDSYAAQRGIAVDDVIVAADGVEVHSLEDLVAAKENLSTGDTVKLTIYRGGGYYNVDIELIDQVTADIY